MPDRSDILAELMALVARRKADPPARSYTTELFAGGVDRIGEKVLEEAAELVEAAHGVLGGGRSESREHFVHELADLIYHVWVLMGHLDVSLAELEAELARRFGTSGLDEKAARGK